MSAGFSLDARTRQQVRRIATARPLRPDLRRWEQAAKAGNLGAALRALDHAIEVLAGHVDRKIAGEKKISKELSALRVKTRVALDTAVRPGDRDVRTVARLRCSFCGKAGRDGVAGPGVYICDECIGRCADVMAARGES